MFAGRRRRWLPHAAAALAASCALAGCFGGGSDRQGRQVADSSAIREVTLDAVPGLSTATRSEQNDRRRLFTGYPKIPGAPALTEALARSENDEIEPFLADTAKAPRAPHAIPELNIQWSLAAADRDVVGVRLTTSTFMGANGGEARRTLWYDGRTGTVLSSAQLLNGTEGLRRLAELVRGRLGTQANPGQVTADPKTFSSLAFNVDGDLVAEFSDYAIAPGAAGRVATVLARGTYEGMLSDFGRRARDASLAAKPRLSLGTVPKSPASSPSAAAGAPKVDCAKAKCVALTFDDGPGPYTGRLLDLLAQRRARATFFVVGNNADAHPDLLRREVSEGHEIGNHTQDHRDLSRLPALQVNQQVQHTQEIVRTTTGRAPVLLRPPYGAANKTVAEVAKSLGLVQALWNVDTNDWRDRDSTVVAERAVSGAHPGAVILMHDIHKTTVEAVPRILDRLSAQGYTFATVSDVLAGRPVALGGRFSGR
ncbi:polysaccharide deacetylase family protein [Spirillospora sp. CA-294931]|uniref:polysaccharide deacetylase family protein n=1 Tax=Spirillospora sp. CA-294931 TaxID=3240042 RepID=UPI003D8D2B8F